uniref:FYVE-type domain-containing protein n=1 Tax=Hyaloperonospora arabidopsidis (strain Emoy2) TaxID=559515 RepID=M4B9E5_HYAAE
MVFFKRPLTEAEQAQRRARKELERLAKTQRKFEAMEEKAQKAQRKQQQKSIARSEKEAQRQAKQEQQAAYKAMKEAKKAAKQRGRLARHAAKLRGHRRDISDRPVSCSATASASDVAGTGTSRPLAKRAHCAVCGKKFGPALHRRRHHCRQCRESCCLQCTSQTRHVIPQTGRTTRQKVCVVCDTLIFTASTSTITTTTTNTMTTAAFATAPVAVREPAEAIVALAAAHRRASIGRRPRSAPLPRTSGVAVAVPCPRGPRARSSQSSSRWKLSMRAGLRKKKRRAEQLRNGDMDHNLQLEKHALFMGPAISVQPQTRMNYWREEVDLHLVHEEKEEGVGAGAGVAATEGKRQVDRAIVHWNLLRPCPCWGRLRWASPSKSRPESFACTRRMTATAFSFNATRGAAMPSGPRALSSSRSRMLRLACNSLIIDGDAASEAGGICAAAVTDTNEVDAAGTIRGGGPAGVLGATVVWC